MSEGLFDRARKYITRELVMQYTRSPDGEVSGDEYKTLNPMRADKHIGSFYINLNSGLWRDYSGDQKGDFFKLVAEVDGITAKEAAEKILKSSGAWEEKSSREKPPAADEITEKDWAELNVFIASDYCKGKWGDYYRGWRFYDGPGQPAYAQVRFIQPPPPGEDKPKKNDIPFYLSNEGEWIPGLPPYYKEKKLPLYNQEMFTAKTKTVILVEGCKCGQAGQAEIGSEQYNRAVMSWGGSSQYNIRRWKWIQDRKDVRVVIWPDKDLQKDKYSGEILPKERQPGMKAVIAIKKKYIPWAEIMDPYALDDHNEFPHGWDIADAIEMKLDIIKIIKTCPRYSGKQIPDEIKNSHPFTFLGYSEESYYFLPRAAPYPWKIRQRFISKIQLMNLACLDWWQYKFPGKTGTDWDSAFDWVIRESQKHGWYDQSKIRGSGFWADDGRIYCNTGRGILTPQGEKIGYHAACSKYIYVQSQLKIKTMSRDTVATNEQGKLLRLLFEAQGFETRLQAWEALGWILWAPFGNLCSWRPGMWITGDSQTGKSHMLTNLITPLACEFAYTGNSRNTIANIKNETSKNVRVAILDEMECRGKRNFHQLQKIENIVEIARDASSDSSNRIKQQSKDGTTEEYVIRSPFLLASMVSATEGEAIENRFLTPTLNKAIRVADKKPTIYKILKTGVMNDPGIFIRRNFRDIKQILENIEWLKTNLADLLCDQRKADNYAPIFAFVFALENTGPITPEFWSELGEMVADIKSKTIKRDESILMDEILTSKIQTDDKKERTVAEMLSMVLSDYQGFDSYRSALIRNGIVYNHLLSYVAIQYNNRYIREMLAETDFSVRYGEVLRRHSLAVDKKLKQVKIDGMNLRCVCFTLKNFIKIMEGEE